jgi:hypothetical protein
MLVKFFSLTLIIFAQKLEQAAAAFAQCAAQQATEEDYQRAICAILPSASELIWLNRWLLSKYDVQACAGEVVLRIFCRVRDDPQPVA